MYWLKASVWFVSFLLSFPAWSSEGQLLRNPGFEESATRPVGWGVAQHAGPVAYEFSLDDEIYVEGNRSFRIERTLEELWGAIRQVVVVPATQGGKQFVRFSAMLRSERVGPDGFGLELVYSGRPLGMLSPPVLRSTRSHGLADTSDWTQVVIEEELPEGTSRITAGVVLHDEGIGWVDDLSLTISAMP